MARSRFSPTLPQELFDALGAAQRLVDPKVQGWGTAKACLASDGLLHAVPMLLECLEHFLVARFVPRRDVDRGMGQVAVGGDIGDADQLEPFVVDPFEFGRDDLAQEFIEPKLAGVSTLSRVSRATHGNSAQSERAISRSS